MYKDEIKALKEEKKEALISILKDYYKLYIKLKIGYPNLIEETVLLKLLIKQYILYDNNEKEILNEIIRIFCNSEYNDTIDQLLYEFDYIFENYYNYIEKCLFSYEEVLNVDIIDTIINRITGKYLETNNLKYRLTIPKESKCFNNEYKEKVLKQIRSI